MTYSGAQAKLADVFNTASEQPMTIVRRSAPDVVVISAEEYEAYQQAALTFLSMNGITIKAPVSLADYVAKAAQGLYAVGEVATEPSPLQ